MLKLFEIGRNEIGLFGRIARKKPYVNKLNRGKRMKFANKMPQKPLQFWDTVIWSDESKFELFSSNGKVMVWRTSKEAFNPQCIVPTVKHGGDSVMIWGCFTCRGVGKLHILDRTMDRFYYHEILEKNLIASIANFGFSNEFIFCWHRCKVSALINHYPACHELISDNSKGKEVHGEGVVLFADDLGSHVAGSSAGVFGIVGLDFS